ncbi:MAG: DEAD/DEAH box helicase [Acidobacteriota bacterium]
MSDLINFEFLGTGIGLLSMPGGDGHTAIYVGKVANLSRPLRSCTCRESNRKTCRHLLALAKGVASARKRWSGRSFQEFFESTVWHRLAGLLHEARPPACDVVRVASVGGAVRVTMPDGRELLRYVDASPARLRFLERTGKAPVGDGSTVDRAELLERLALFQLNTSEYRLRQAGMPSNRESWQRSIWYRVAYHCVREFGDGGTFHPAVDKEEGTFVVTYRDPEGRAVLEISVPRPRVDQMLRLLATAYPAQDDLKVRPIPLQALRKVMGDSDLEVEVRPVLRALDEHGVERFFEIRERFRYGDLAYLWELGVLVRIDGGAADQPLTRLRLERGQIATFLDENRDALAEGTLVLDQPLQHLNVFKEVDDLRVLVGEGERWDEVTVYCGFGDDEIPLTEIAQAKKAGLPFLETESGWVDLNSPAIRSLTALGGATGEMSAGHLLRLKGALGEGVRLAGEEAGREWLDRIIDLRPSEPWRATPGLRSELRPYQRHGVDWLRFLVENRLGGLLCDDMGLGKTHQAMALMVSLLEQGEGGEGPFLVVCPTSVVPHWENKIREHAPGLKVEVHHGPDRDLETSLSVGPRAVILTSYGVMLRDAKALAKVAFRVIFFDEIQHLKNRQTQAFKAARTLKAESFLGLTGTPVENALQELKTLMDVVLPGYLGTDAEFAERYGGDRPPRALLDELRRSLAPFVLRRLKSSVLDELPEKFEDLRFCSLARAQETLYRDVVATRGAALAKVLRSGDGPVPYLHVFALLNQLKQICDHPALALRDLDRASDHVSGKWNLFKEILAECLDSGHKVVVFSQYLGMIELMRRHLVAGGTEHEILIGKSRNRGALVERFNNDPDCRVFLASLKAGGTGIDLVGASIVIHYDRWWNAAREDQATDRVHRIGQKRAVQVFKLVTQGTLEERIAAMIDRKRQLLEDVVEEDDPRLSKVFSREELLELLSPP